MIVVTRDYCQFIRGFLSEERSPYTVLLDIVSDHDRLVHLYKNDYTPHEDSKLEDFVEADFKGYAPAAVSFMAWNQRNMEFEGRNSVLIRANWVRFRVEEPQTVYGYYVTDTANTVLEWAERFRKPQKLDPELGWLALMPSLGLTKW